MYELLTAAPRVERPLLVVTHMQVLTCDVVRVVRLQGSVPPVMAFHLGSLGFLTPFKFDSYKTEVVKVLEGDGRRRSDPP